MTDVSPTLALIDGAIDHNAVSDIAMRWRPSEPWDVGSESVTVQLDNRDAKFVLDEAAT